MNFKKLNEDDENDFERKKLINDYFDSIYGIRAFLSSIARHTDTCKHSRIAHQSIDSFAFNQFKIERSLVHSQPAANTAYSWIFCAFFKLRADGAREGGRDVRVKSR